MYDIKIYMSNQTQIYKYVISIICYENKTHGSRRGVLCVCVCARQCSHELAMCQVGTVHNVHC